MSPPGGKFFPEMHQATDVAACHRFRTAGKDGIDLAVGHGQGNVGILEAEGPAETAAGVGIVHLYQFKAVNLSEELARLVADAQNPREMAGFMVGD